MQNRCCTYNYGRNESTTSKYWTISLTSVMGKLLESVIARCIQEHLYIHGLIRDSQHGITGGKLGLTNLLLLYRMICEAADEDKKYDIVHLDFG